MIIEKVGAVVPGKNTPVYLERSRYGAPNNDTLYGLCPCGSGRIFFFLTCPLFDFDFELRFSWSSERRWESGGIGSKAVKKCRYNAERAFFQVIEGFVL